jgi:hydroxymethylglutaryl-CoA reductase
MVFHLEIDCTVVYFDDVMTSLYWKRLCRSSRFARLQGVKCAMAGRNLYMRFTCSTGDAMGMNMVSKGVQNVLDYLQDDFPDMDVVSISGIFLPRHMFIY